MVSEFLDLLWGRLTLIEKGLVIFTVLFYIFLAAYSPSTRSQAFTGIRSGATTLVRVLLLILAGVFLGSAVGAMIPREVIARSIGGESGFTGIVIGTLVGALIPGGPYVLFPLVASFYSIGAGVPALIAMIFAWTCIAVTRLPLEIGFLSAVGGERLILYRILIGIPLPLLAGVLAGLLVGVRL